MKSIAILGSTGSIGTSALEVVRANAEQFRVALLVAGRRAHELAAQVREFRPDVAAVAGRAAYEELCAELGVSRTAGSWEHVRLIYGEDWINSAIKESRASTVLAAVVGMAGLPGVLAALDAGKDVALANKESLVVAGALVLERAKERGARLIPVDSEHSAIFQVLQGTKPNEVKSLILTASGGPFRATPLEEFGDITPEQALKHPQWTMGAKITIDSATMMNKALEVIEARWLFDVASDDIEVVIHPQSIIHSMVRLKDETVLAQMSLPDMKGPIAYALRYPESRLPGVMKPLDLTAVRELSFEPVDERRFPGIRRAHECLRGARGACAVLNAANEVAVAQFLSHRITFPSIHALIEESLARFGDRGYESLGDLVDLCTEVTEWARQRVSTFKGR